MSVIRLKRVYCHVKSQSVVHTKKSLCFIQHFIPIWQLLQHFLHLLMLFWHLSLSSQPNLSLSSWPLHTHPYHHPDLHYPPPYVLVPIITVITIIILSVCCPHPLWPPDDWFPRVWQFGVVIGVLLQQGLQISERFRHEGEESETVDRPWNNKSQQSSL